MGPPEISTAPSSRNTSTVKPPSTTSDRRHINFHPTTEPSPPPSRQGSTTSTLHTGSDTRKYSNASVSSASSSQKGSSNGLKSLFSRKGSKDEKSKTQHVITSKYAGAVRNKLRADPKINASRRASMGDVAAGVVQRPSAHITAQEQEMRHPHSGPGGHGAALTTIMSRFDEEDAEEE